MKKGILDMMLSQVRPALVILTLMTLLTGVAYPALVTAVAQVAFPSQANGSLIVVNGSVVGSALIGQPFDEPRYFWGRPSATAPYPYNAAASTGSNLGPTNPALTDAVATRIAALRAAGAPANQPVPADLVTASGSGLDPDISVAAALYQAPRVARVRGLTEDTVRELIAQHTTARQFGVLGEARINVLQLNLALDAAQK
jgi:potassium-transporting ATPase KdpC subunit